jgi:hypothetical protein
VTNLTERRFLTFMTNSPVGLNLTEWRFRSYWDRTAEHGNANERVRFRARRLASMSGGYRECALDFEAYGATLRQARSGPAGPERRRAALPF